MTAFLQTVYVIWLRELIKFWREKVRIVTSLIQPAVWLFIAGKGLGSTFRGPMGVDYVHFMFPGVIGMTILFTSVFSAISIVWDREFGFLKAVLVAPIPRTSVVIGKALSGSTIALIQGTMVMVFSIFIGVKLSPLIILQAWCVMFLMSFALSSMGIVVAARMQSFHSFQLIMNFLVMPMYFLSGAIFPVTRMPVWMRGIALINPMAYGVDALKNILVGIHEFSLGRDLLMVAGYAVIMASFAVFLFNRKG